MRVAIVGSRDYPHADQRVRNRITRLLDDYDHSKVTIITGGAFGPDSIAARTGKRLGLEVVVFEPDYDGLGHFATFARNTLIVDACDRVVAFWDLRSRGTADTIAKAFAAHKPVEVWGPDNEACGWAAEQAVEIVKRQRLVASLP